MNTAGRRFAIGLLFGVVSMCSPAWADLMYATGNNGSALIKFDTTTAATTVIGNFTTPSTYGLAFAPDGTAYTLQGSQETLAKVNLSTGALTTIGGPGGFFGYALDFSPTGVLYAFNVNTGQVDTVNTTTGAFTPVGTSGVSDIMDVAFTSAGDLYVVPGSANVIYQLNPVTFSVIAGFGTSLGNLMGIAADNSGDLIATSYTNPSQFETFNLTTHASSVTGTIGAGTSFDHGGDIVLSSVPEPTSILLLASVIISLAVLTRKKIAFRVERSAPSATD